MSDEAEYVPREGDMVIFDRPPSEGGKRPVFQVASHDAETGMTTFARLPRALPADEMAERGARRMEVVSPGGLEPNWTDAGRRLAGEGAGRKPKIYQLASRGDDWIMGPADEQAALALAQRAADETGEPVILARADTGELVIGSRSALEAAGEGLRTRTVLLVQPRQPGSSGVDLRSARQILGGNRVREAVMTTLTSVLELPDSASSIAAEAAVEAIARLLPPEENTRHAIPAWPGWPGWQGREELLPEGTDTATLLKYDSGPCP